MAWSHENPEKLDCIKAVVTSYMWKGDIIVAWKQPETVEKMVILSKYTYNLPKNGLEKWHSTFVFFLCHICKQSKPKF